MHSINIKFDYLIVFVVLISSCNNGGERTNGREIERVKLKVEIKYNNGNIYCEGVYSVLKKDSSSKNCVEIWKQYYPSGSLDDITEYDDEGNSINYKNYSESGILLYSEYKMNENTYSTSYYLDGKLKNETVYTIETKFSGDYDFEKEYEQSTDYYRNGQIASKTMYVDGVLQGIKNVWDSTGLLVLSVEYKNGLILTK